MTIRRRITLVTAGAVAVTVILVSIGAFLAARRQVLAPIDDSLLARASVVANVLPGGVPQGIVLGEVPIDRLFRPGRGDFDSAYYQVILPIGRTFNIGQDDLILPAPSERDLDLEQPTLRSVWVDGLHLRVVTVSQPGADVFIQIGRPLTEADETLRRFAGMLVFGSALGIALAAGLGMLVSRSAVKPIESLQTEIAEITETGQLSTRLDSDTDDEVGRLADTFNTLLGELEQSQAQQVRLVRDAGHELKTPLTALRVNLELLQRHSGDAEDRQQMLDAARAEVEELSELVIEVVDLATDRYEEEQVAEVDLTEIAAGVSERLERRRGRVVVIESDDSTVMAKHDAVERALANIVANADKWSPDDGMILVAIENGSVAVTDSGPGIAPSDLPHVFERFYRSDLARQTPGSGLGLSIVQQIVDDHGGEVFVRNRDDGSGAIVGFSLPVDKES